MSRGIITYSGYDTGGKCVLGKVPPIEANIGTNITSGAIDLTGDGISSVELTDIVKVDKYDECGGRECQVKVGNLSFKGEVTIIELNANAGEEKVIYRATNSSAWLARAMIAGRKVKAHSGTMILYGENCTFNPGGRPNMDGRTSWSDPCFCSPEWESKLDNDELPHNAVHFSTAAMLGYVTANSIGGGGKGSVAYSGGPSAIKGLYPSDISVGGSVLSAIGTILNKSKQTYIIDPVTDELKIVSTKSSGTGRDIILPRDNQQVTDIKGVATNDLSVTLDYGNRNVSRVYGAGAPKRFEVTVPLCNGWDPALEVDAESYYTGSYTKNTMNKMEMSSDNPYFETYKDVGRKYVVNDAGFYESIYSTFSATAYNWSSDLDGGNWYPHRRPFLDRRLTKDPVTGEGLPPILEFRYSAAAPNWLIGFPQEWVRFNGGWELLKDEAGVYISDPHGLYHPSFGFPEFRITTGVEGDAPLMPYLAVSGVDNKYDRCSWVTGLGQFVYEKVTTSIFGEAGEIRNDQDRLHQYLLDQEERLSRKVQVSARIVIPWIDYGWMPGDYVYQIVNTKGAKSIDIDQMVLGVRYEFGNMGYRTQLTLGTPGV